MPAYLDHNATAPLRPEVIDLMAGVLRECGNPSSLHVAGRVARKHVEDARAQVAALVQYRAQNVIFTSGATEANNMIIKGHPGPVAVSAIEHPSVIEARPDLIKIPVTADGLIDLPALETVLAEQKPQLVAVMAVNNETGVIQPVAEIGRLCRAAGVLFHCDAVQAAGKIDIDFEAWNCDFLSLSAHKFGGPQGAGALIFKSQVPVPRLLHGGGQERRQRSGTENVAAIAGFGLAAELAGQTDTGVLQSMRDALETTLGDKIVIHGKAAPRVANTTCFSVPGKRADTMLMALDLGGVYISSGSACSSGSIKPSHVLQAMGVPDDLCAGALRVSLGWNTTQEEIDAFLAAWSRLK